MATGTTVDLARPIDFEARYGEGLGTGVSLGGGGIWFVSWQVAYLFELASAGVDVAGADRIVGTSAGSVVSSVLEAGNLSRLHTELKVLAKLPKLIGVLAPASKLSASQETARDLFATAPDADPDRVRDIGHAALAASTPSAATMARNVGLILGSRSWPSSTLHITAVDAFTGERLVLTNRARVPLPRAVAASSAVPGLFAPQPIADRRCMDGGVSGSGTHLDLLAGARRALVVSLTDGSAVVEPMMTVSPGDIEAEFDALRGTGTELLVRTPEAVDPDRLMDPSAVPDAIAMGRRQAVADAEELRTFLGSS